MSYQTYPLMLRHPEGKERIVTTPDEERRWQAHGYERPGRPDPEAFISAKDLPEGQPEHQEYPKWVDGKIVQDPQAPKGPPPGAYPKMVGDRIFQTEDEEIAALLEADEEHRVPAHERAAERDALLSKAKQAGMRVDARWGLERLRAFVNGATH